MGVGVCVFVCIDISGQIYITCMSIYTEIDISSLCVCCVCVCVCVCVYAYLYTGIKLLMDEL